MSKYFHPWNIDQTLLLPPNVQDFVPKGHVSRFIVELVRESLDLQEITGRYVSGLGPPPFDPRMMGALLGGIPFGRGALYYLLSNHFYIGEVKYKNEILPGDQPPIMDRALFDAV